MIVTTNLKHFPDDALKPYQIKALHPDDFLLDQLDLYEEATKAVILGMVDAYIDPPFTPHSLLDALGEQVPQFAAKARRLFPVRIAIRPRRPAPIRSIGLAAPSAGAYASPRHDQRQRDRSGAAGYHQHPTAVDGQVYLDPEDGESDLGGDGGLG